MLSAKKEDLTSAVRSLEALQSTDAPRNLVVSIQGLQQRLGDFSLEEVTDAESKTKTLIVRLSDLHDRLAVLGLIKRSMTLAGDRLEQADIDQQEVITHERSSAPSQPQETFCASNLIRFPLGVRLAQQNTRQILPDAVTRPAFSDLVPGFTRESVQADSGEQTTSFVLVNPMDFPDISKGHKIGDNSSMAQKPQRFGHDPATRKPPAPLGEPTHVTSDDLADADELNQTTAAAIARGHEESVTVTTVDRLPAKFEFDQQLLDDLIENYGEFISSSDVGVTAKPQGPEASAQTVISKMILEPPGPSLTNPFHRPFPVAKREGEIDRELKKIIKDYGAYDIYSRQNPTRLKLGVIGAFFLLAAVFSGLYFFSSATSSNPTAVTQPATITSGTERGSHYQDNSGSREVSTTNLPLETKK